MEHIHTYKLIRENPDGRLEICKVCKHKLRTQKDPKTGRIDNKKYLKEHIADTAQPTGVTAKVFGKLYGEAPKDLRYK